MKSLTTDITLNQLADINRFSSLFARFGNDYIFSRFAPGVTDGTMFGFPTHIAAMAVCLVRKGYLHGEVDSTPVELNPHSLFVFGRSNIVNLTWDSNSEIEVDILFMSPQFLHDLNFDLSVINLHGLVDRKPDPIFSSVTEIDFKKLDQLMSLLYLTANNDAETPFAKNIARCLAQALIYQLLLLNERRIKSQESVPTQQSRQASYVLDFMRLLHIHHTQQRSISFYAEKLFISPKYLSHLIKESTGKSASEIIGNTVIQEAKNLLRYSNKNIQQIAYELNFSTQSSFGKYFKHFTGLSPSEFQKK